MISEFLFGYPYLNTKKLLRETEFNSQQEHQLLQNKLLGKVLKNAVENIPFYQKLLINKKIDFSDNVRQALSSFPIINKKIIRKNLADFLNGNKIRRLKVNTGGSTGSPLVFYIDRFITRQKEKAFIFDQWSRIGYNFRDPIFNIRGRTPSKEKFIQHDKFFNIYYASSFNLNKTKINDYISAINKIHPYFIHGYPSTIYQLASLIEASGKSLNFIPKAVFCGSEKLFHFQKEKIENVFGCSIYHWYGQSECVALGGYCNQSETLHFYPQYGITELIPAGFKDENGRELYEIVATGFNNPVMPFIRYRTGDYAIPSKKKLCSCGRNYLLIKEVVGRQQEFVVDSSRSLISATSLIFGQHYKVFEGIESIKLHQQQPGILDVIIVKDDDFKEELFKIMKEKMNELIGCKMTLIFSFVQKTEKTPLLKAKLVDQKLDINTYLKG